MRLVLTPGQLEQINAAAQAAWPAEACGLLVGPGASDGLLRIDDVVPADNLLAGERHDRFELDPVVHIATLRRLRGSDQAVVGHWHSHPGGTARPSIHDIEAAVDPALIWLIVAVADGRAGEAAAWRIDPISRQAAPVALLIEKTP